MTRPLLFAGLGAAALGGLALATRDSLPANKRLEWQKEAQAIADQSRTGSRVPVSGKVGGSPVTYTPGQGYSVAGGDPVDSPYAVALVVWRLGGGRANRRNWEEDWEEDWEKRDRKARELARKLGLPPVGLNADWSVTAWHAGPSDSPNMTGGDVYILEDEEAHEPTYLVVRRWYVDDGHETGQQYLGLPDKYREWADGHNDAIVELGSYSTFAKAATAAVKLRDQFSRKGHRATKEKVFQSGYAKGQKFGKLDRDYGNRFNDKGTTVHRGGWQKREYLRGWAAGYRQAYHGRNGRRSTVVPLHSAKNLKRVCRVLEE